MPETPQIPASSRGTSLSTPETPTSPDTQRNLPHDVQREAHRTAHVAEMRAARAAGVRWRRISRWLGLGIFMLGALLLVYVFWVALKGLQYFSDPGRLNSDFNMVSGDTLPSVIQAVVTVFGTQLLRVLYLFILGFIASAVAARGIQFFAASEAVIDEAVVPDEEF